MQYLVGDLKSLPNALHVILVSFSAGSVLLPHARVRRRTLT
ncbi:hypothetical protein [Gordonia zhenghanii]|nr:hypothetical protein [Gordonia zhenghanii]